MRAALLLLAVGCSFRSGATSPDAANSPIDAVDGPIVDGCMSFSVVVDTCAVTFGSGMTMTGSHTYDTDTQLLDGGPGPAFVIQNGIVLWPVASFTLAAGGSLRVDGSMAFGIVATSTIEIDGLIDLTNDGGGHRSAADCGMSEGAVGETNPGGGGGGGGGGFRSVGGTGGPGNKDQSSGHGVSVGGIGGIPVLTKPTTLIGGCDGGDGGVAGGVSGAGGGGGGAILLAAVGTIAIAGVINTGGGGGAPGVGNGAGGGGGGSGGMILIDGHAMLAGSLAANGGGGGEGNNGNAGQTGLASTTKAKGGTGGDPAGGDGAPGSAGTTLAGTNATDLQDGGGGGGGGGAGLIATTKPTTGSGTVSPAAQTWP